MNISQNILKWYSFKENASVLEIYNESSIMETMNKKIQLVTADINQLNIQGEYDYITLIGTYEYAPLIMKQEKSYSEFLKMLKQHLKPDGIILLAIDNRLGIKYLAGAKNENYSRVFEGIESKIRQETSNLLLKKEIIKFIKEAEFKKYKFYYPLPDYMNANSIFTDEFLPKSNHSKILYPVHYEKGSTVVYNEINVMKQICDIKQFDNFTNSYLVEITNEGTLNDTKFVNYNSLRKDKYQLLLTIKQNVVEKIAENSEATNHVQEIKRNVERLLELGFKVSEKVEDGKIISEFIDVEELDKKIVRNIENNDKNQFFEEIRKWYEYIKQRLKSGNLKGQDIFEKYNIEIPDEEKKKLEFVEDGFIDISFENIFCQDEYLLYDQEWYIENVPIEFILYRAINNLYTYNERKIENKIEKQELFKIFNIDNYILYFEKLEQKIQQEILDETKVKNYREKISHSFINIETTINKVNELNEHNLKLREELQTCKIQYINEIMKLKDEMEEHKNKLQQLEQKYNGIMEEYNTSYIWKIVRKLKKFRRKV